MQIVVIFKHKNYWKNWFLLRKFKRTKNYRYVIKTRLGERPRLICDQVRYYSYFMVWFFNTYVDDNSLFCLLIYSKFVSYQRQFVDTRWPIEMFSLLMIDQKFHLKTG